MISKYVGTFRVPNHLLCSGKGHETLFLYEGRMDFDIALRQRHMTFLGNDLTEV